MKNSLLFAVILMSVATFVFFKTAAADDTVKDAKDVYTQFVKAAKSKKIEVAKKFLAKDALTDLEKDNTVDFFIAMQADIKPETIKAAKAEMKGAMVVLDIKQVEKGKDGSSSTSMTVFMVKENGQWKVGKPGE